VGGRRPPGTLGPLAATVTVMPRALSTAFSMTAGPVSSRQPTAGTPRRESRRSVAHGIPVAGPVGVAAAHPRWTWRRGDRPDPSPPVPP
jgi:hypothetical protein